MGLDMYLSRRTYVGNKWREPEQRIKIKYPKDQKDVTFKIEKSSIDDSKISYIIEEVAYWRKANQIHEWFVQNVQDGDDNCGDYYVKHEQIEALVNLCKATLKIVETDKPIPEDMEDWSKWEDITVRNQGKLETLLPTVNGFFFGNTEYNGAYLYDLRLTINQLEPLIKKDKNGKFDYSGSFYYQSSW